MRADSLACDEGIRARYGVRYAWYGPESSGWRLRYRNFVLRDAVRFNDCRIIERQRGSLRFGGSNRTRSRIDSQKQLMNHRGRNQRHRRPRARDLDRDWHVGGSQRVGAISKTIVPDRGESSASEDSALHWGVHPRKWTAPMGRDARLPRKCSLDTRSSRAMRQGTRCA